MVGLACVLSYRGVYKCDRNIVPVSDICRLQTADYSFVSQKFFIRAFSYESLLGR